MGKGQSAACGFNRFEAEQADNFSGRQKANRGGTAGTVGEGEGGAEEGCLVAWEACCELCGRLSRLPRNYTSQLWFSAPQHFTQFY
jgi:hypothetical protein